MALWGLNWGREKLCVRLSSCESIIIDIVRLSLKSTGLSSLENSISDEKT